MPKIKKKKREERSVPPGGGENGERREGEQEEGEDERPGKGKRGGDITHQFGLKNGPNHYIINEKVIYWTITYKLYRSRSLP